MKATELKLAGSIGSMVVGSQALRTPATSAATSQDLCGRVPKSNLLFGDESLQKANVA